MKHLVWMLDAIAFASNFFFLRNAILLNTEKLEKIAFHFIPVMKIAWQRCKEQHK